MKNSSRQFSSFLLLSGFLFLTGCAPISPLVPFHFAETSRILPAGKASLTLAGGFGNLKGMGDGVGGGARARFGLGGEQELGVEAAYTAIYNSDSPGATMPWLGNSNVFSEKVSWKTGLSSWLSAVVGAGGSHSATGDALGGDLAFIGSPEKPIQEVLPYAGLRGSLAVPVGRGGDEAGGMTRGVVLAVGGVWQMDPKFNLFVEGAGLKTWNHGYSSTSADPNRVVQDNQHDGFYLAFGGIFFIGGEEASSTVKDKK